MEPLEPIRHALMIEADQERTFHMFVRRLAAWWPMETRAITSGTDMDELRVEEWVGGRIYQVHDLGGEHDWGHVTSWNPPDSFSFTWKIVPDPEFTEVDLHFRRLGPVLTRVVVEHHGWERMSTALLDRYTKYAGGWQAALRRFAAMFEGGPRVMRSVSDDSESRG
ncbi:hypothetical protein GCM10009780_15600 [Actinomadura alba]